MAVMPVPHSIWQSSRSPLATDTGLSLQREVQRFHFASCHRGSRGTILGAAISTATFPLRTVGSTYLRGPVFTWGRQTEESFFPLLEPGCLTEDGTMLGLAVAGLV